MRTDSVFDRYAFTPFPDDRPLIPVEDIESGLDRIEQASAQRQAEILAAQTERLLVAATPLLERGDTAGITLLNWTAQVELQRPIATTWALGWQLGGVHMLAEMRAALPDEIRQRDGFARFAVTDEQQAAIADMLKLEPVAIANTAAEQAVLQRSIQLAGNFAGDQLSQLKTDLIAAINPDANGRVLSRRELLDRIQKNLNVGKSRAETIARTELTAAYNTGRIQTALQSSLVSHFRFLAISDARTTPICRSRNGMLIPAADQNAVAANRPPLHGRCRSTLSPVLSTVNPTHQGWVDDPTRDYRNRDLTPLPKGWRTDTTGGVSYQNLLDRGRQLTAELGDLTDLERMKELRSQLIKSGLSKSKAANITAATRITDEAADTWKLASSRRVAAPDLNEVVTEFHQMTGGTLRNVQGFIKAEDRAYALVKDGLINLGDDPHELSVYHELGHMLEAQHPELARVAREWRSARATGSQQSLKSLTGLEYGEGELALPDRFVSPYVGKLDDSGLTEVFSVGFEHFGSPEGMRYLLERDPDHFHLILGAIDEARLQRLAITQGKLPSNPLYIDFDGGYRPLTPVEAELKKLQQKRAQEFADYLKREEESIQRRTSGEIDRKLREYYDEEAAVLRKRLNIPDPPAASGALKLKSYTPTALRQLEIADDLTAVAAAELNPTQAAALKVAREYQEVLKEINEAVARIPAAGKTLPGDAYDRIFDKTTQLADRLAALTNEARTLGKVDNDVLEGYMARISKTSKETLPGYKIQSLDAKLAQRAAVRPC